jgi:hypothetical protein
MHHDPKNPRKLVVVLSDADASLLVGQLVYDRAAFEQAGNAAMAAVMGRVMEACEAADAPLDLEPIDPPTARTRGQFLRGAIGALGFDVSDSPALELGEVLRRLVRLARLVGRWGG